MKILKDDSLKTSRKDFILARRIVEILLYLMAAIQLFQEFSDSRYFDQLLMILSLTGLVVFFCGAAKKNDCILENYETEYHTEQKEMMDFHNNFIASMFIPMLFLFRTDDVIFTNTTLWNLDTAKMIIIAVAFVSFAYYRFLVYFSKRYSQKNKSVEARDEAEEKKRKFNFVFWLSFGGMILDGVLICLNLLLVGSMEWKNMYFSNVTLNTWFFLAVCCFVFFFLQDKKHVILYIAAGVTVLSVAYNGYMQFSEEKPYSFGTADYMDTFILDEEDKTYINIACRFETDENNQGVYKCYMGILKEDEEELKFQEEAIAYGTYEAIEYKNSFREWQDRNSDIFYKKSELKAGEMPVSFRILNEKVVCVEDGELKQYIDSEKHVTSNFDDLETESIVVGNGYIDFRGNELEKTEDLYAYIDHKLNEFEPENK